MRYRNAWSEATIVATADVAANVRQIEIAPAAGAQPYGAGAHLDVSLLIDEKPEIRSYSLVGPYRSNQPYRIAVKRLVASRGRSLAMWALVPSAPDDLTATEPLRLDLWAPVVYAYRRWNRHYADLWDGS
jgi:ferredoxin-NADP reductase